MALKVLSDILLAIVTIIDLNPIHINLYLLRIDIPRENGVVTGTERMRLCLYSGVFSLSCTVEEAGRQIWPGLTAGMCELDDVVAGMGECEWLESTLALLQDRSYKTVS